MQVIGVDTGGTFTDTVLRTADGRVGVGKTLSSATDPGGAVLRSVEAAAATLDLDLDTALAGTGLFGHGTTIGLNALLTGTGARVCLVTTAGFTATLPIARINKVHGLADDDRLEPTRWSKPPLLVPRERIAGVTERVDSHGAVVTPLDEAQARAAVRRLAGQGVESVAVCLLWSTVNPVHERRLRALLAEELPGVHVSLSSELAPRIGEYERTVTTVLDAYVAPLVGAYLTELDSALRRHGFAGRFVLLQSGGGVRQVTGAGGDRTWHQAWRAVDTLNSGPVGGLAATVEVGHRLGHPDVIATDVGGTSFDVGLVVGGQLTYQERPAVDRHVLASPAVDVLSIGTGGGSLAWVDHELGALRVGPASAGSDPGPACYARGGQQPTLTDAAVALGYLDRLGGELRLDRDAAVSAIRTHLAEPLGSTVEATADGVLRVAAAHMADLVRRATVRRGHDPRTFALYAYGGAAAQYAGRYAADLGCREVVVPDLAATFSAGGAVSSDLRTAAEQDLHPCDLATSAGVLAATVGELEARVRDELGGLDTGEAPRLTRSAGLRFRRQLHQLQVELPDGDVDQAAATVAAKRFRDAYEQVVGAGTAYAEAPVEAVGVTVEGRLRLGTGAPLPPPPGAPPPPPRPARTRVAWFDGVTAPRPVYERADLVPGATVPGPAFVELPTTTLVVYPGQRALVDPGGHLRLELGGTR